MHTWSIDRKRAIVLLTSGNLATSQASINMINESIKTDSENIMKCNSMFQVARIIGNILRKIKRE